MKAAAAIVATATAAVSTAQWWDGDYSCGGGPAGPTPEFLLLTPESQWHWFRDKLVSCDY